MINFTKKIKQGLLILLIFVLLLPLIQKRYKLFKIDWLKGAIVEVPNVKFSSKKWLSSDYQERKEKYINHSFGFREVLIRLNNQLVFDYFQKARANNVVVGKNNYLYEENYIKSYYGIDFIGKDSISTRIEKLKYIQDTLQKLNKTFVLIFAAGKGFYYPEFIPNYLKTKKHLTNYKYYLKCAKIHDINHIDFNNYFMKNKYKSQYPLYPQYGIHWSKYGCWLAADSIISYIESKRNINMRNIFWDSVEIKQPNAEDYDIAAGMNLNSHLKSFNMAYPIIQFEDEINKTKPNVLMISDSFYWGIYGGGISAAFNKSAFWYYNNEVYSEIPGKQFVKDLNLNEQIKKYDVIAIMSTPATMPELGWGFIENLYHVFYKNEKHK